jgi:hypothetical protein
MGIFADRTKHLTLADFPDFIREGQEIELSSERRMETINNLLGDSNEIVLNKERNYLFVYRKENGFLFSLSTNVATLDFPFDSHGEPGEFSVVAPADSLRWPVQFTGTVKGDFLFDMIEKGSFEERSRK